MRFQDNFGWGYLDGRVNSSTLSLSHVVGRETNTPSIFALTNCDLVESDLDPEIISIVVGDCHVVIWTVMTMEEDAEERQQEQEALAAICESLPRVVVRGSHTRSLWCADGDDFEVLPG